MMKIRVISSADLHNCPITSLDVNHYRDDGTCLCIKPGKPLDLCQREGCVHYWGEHNDEPPFACHGPARNTAGLPTGPGICPCPSLEDPS